MHFLNKAQRRRLLHLTASTVKSKRFFCIFALMDSTFVKDYAIKVLLEETPNEQSTTKLNFFTYLINNGLIDGQRLKKGCINHYYDKMCKEGGCSDKNAILDTAIEFDCSTRTVYNVVYKFKEVRLRFS